MRSIYLHIDHERAAHACETSKILGQDVLFAQSYELSASYDVLSLYGSMCHEAPEHPTGRDAEFFWASKGENFVALGAVVDALHVTSFDALAAYLTQWESQCVDGQTAKLLRVMGGLSFDPTSSSDETPPHISWSHYGQGRFWVPRCMVHYDASRRQWILTLCTSLGASMTGATLAAHLKREADYAESWLIAAVRHDVSREPLTCQDKIACEEPLAQQWGEAVAQATQTMSTSETLQKVVLARTVEVDLGQRVRPAPVLSHLVRSHPTCTTFLARPGVTAPTHAPIPRFLGASPECLVRMSDGKLYVDALAGSAPLDVDDETFLQSKKDRHEHQLVVDEIARALSPHAELELGEVFVDALSNIKHLRTPVSGSLRGDAGLTSLAQALHPTPAVCGKPQDVARRYLQDNEHGTFLHRGWYTGVVGWTDLYNTRGEFFVALRCGLLTQQCASLFVGAGIVPGSDPELELAETRTKGQAMFRALVHDDEVSL